MDKNYAALKQLEDSISMKCSFLSKKMIPQIVAKGAVFECNRLDSKLYKLTYIAIYSKTAWRVRLFL